MALTPSVPSTPPVTLSGRQLLVLQLRARRYSTTQIASLLATDGASVEREERKACAALGVPTADEAIAILRRRRSII